MQAREEKIIPFDSTMARKNSADQLIDEVGSIMEIQDVDERRTAFSQWNFRLRMHRRRFNPSSMSHD